MGQTDHGQTDRQTQGQAHIASRQADSSRMHWWHLHKGRWMAKVAPLRSTHDRARRQYWKTRTADDVLNDLGQCAVEAALLVLLEWLRYFVRGW